MKVTISSDSYSHTTDDALTARLKKVKKVRYWKRAAARNKRMADVCQVKKGQRTIPAVLSDETRERLQKDALAHPAFAGMEPDAIRQYMNERIELFLREQPFWFGHVPGADARHRASQRQYKSAATAAPKQSDQSIIEEGAL